MLRTYIINFISKIGLAIPLLYVALASLFDPATIVSRWPLFLSKNLNGNALVLVTGAVSLCLIVWLFTNKYKFQSSVTTLAGIVLVGLFNIRDMGLLFSLVPLFCLALGLSLRYYPRVRVVVETKVTIPKEHILEQVEKYSDEIDDEDIEDIAKTIKTTTDDHDQHLFIPENK
jgi:hypothetical protein